jgi:hypothetical protein
MHPDDPLQRAAYTDQKKNAGTRGIPFWLTFEEWLGIWKASGHLAERGRRRGQYVMARFGDRGAYETGNVEIIPAEVNLNQSGLSPENQTRLAAMSEANRGRPRPDVTARNLSKNKINRAT